MEYWSTGVLEYWKKLYEEKDRGFEDTKVVIPDVIVYRSPDYNCLNLKNPRHRKPMQPLSASMSDLLFLPFRLHLECNHSIVRFYEKEMESQRHEVCLKFIGLE